MGQSHSQSQTHISVLPNEVVVSILQNLPPCELKSAVLVCQYLREMGENPRFWTWAVVRVNTKDDLQKLKIPRLQMVQEIDVTLGSRVGNGIQTNWIKEEGLEDLFKVVDEIPTVKRISGLEFCKGIQGIQPDLVVSVLNSLEELKLCYWVADDDDEEEDEEEMQLNLSTEQLEFLLTAVAEKTNLKFLQVSGQNMEKDLEAVGLQDEMDEINATDVVTEMGTIVSYDRDTWDRIDEILEIAQISPKLFAAAVTNVEEVILKEHSKEDFTSKQFEALYSLMAAEDRPVRKLTCKSYYIAPMGEENPAKLSKAINRLEEFTTVDAGNVEQWTAILRGLVEGDSRLKKLMVEQINPRVVENLDQNLVRRVKEKVGEFYTELE